VLDAVLAAYDGALTRVFLVGAIMAAAALLPALCMEWKSVKKDQAKKGNGKGPDVEIAPVVDKAQWLFVVYNYRFAWAFPHSHCDFSFVLYFS
jgi:hypothetical protein